VTRYGTDQLNNADLATLAAAATRPTTLANTPAPH
jgi:hypothetical protein